MLYLLIFTPAIIAILVSIFCQYKRKFTTGFVTISIISMMVIIRFTMLAFEFERGSLTEIQQTFNAISAMYVVPTMHMFLCDQCGLHWNNSRARFMLILPLIVVFDHPTIYLGSMESGVEPTDLVMHAFNIYMDGERILAIRLLPIIVITQCILMFYGLIRLHIRIKNYGLHFTRPMKGFFVWLSILLFVISYTHLTNLYIVRNHSVYLTYFIFYSIFLAIGFSAIPYSFRVAPIATNDTDKPVNLSNFIETNRHLADHLHLLFEEDRIYLRPGLKIEDVATIMGTNRSYVSRLMKQEFHQTFVDYVNNARVVYSKRLLLASSMSLEDIAQASGFLDASSYCRVFKRMTDTTPMAWKNDQIE